MAQVLTTGEVATMCGVNFRTVIRWIERGLLTSYRLPGRGDHRVAIDELRRFMRENGIPDPSQPVVYAKRILIADDEKMMAKAIERVLRGAGYETAIATNGFEAAAQLFTFKPGLITMDLCMPGVDGIDVLRYMRTVELPAPLKVLVVSADTAERLQTALELGADDVLRKPFENDPLLASVADLFADPCPSRLMRGH